MSYVKNLDINGSPYEIKSVAVDDVRSGNAIKTWTGTKAQYDAITTKDANTLYNITDDTDVTIPLLELLYPIGSLYIATANVSVCPLAVLGVGTWQQKANSTLVTDVNSVAPVRGNGMTLGLTEGTQNLGMAGGGSNYLYSHTSLYATPIGTAQGSGSFQTTDKGIGITTDSTKSGIEANITSTTLSVIIWERIS